MKLSTAVTDANAVIGLAKGGVFDLLPSLYATVYVPTGVVREVLAGGPHDLGVIHLTQALGAWLIEETPNVATVQQFSRPRAPADREILAVARERAVDQILTSDEPLLRQAVALGFICLRTTEVVVLMKDQGLISAVQPVLDQMRLKSYCIDTVIYQKALRAAGE